ncbi:MAG: hypothetical protein KAJ58_00475 [Candidatus Pacebacteria bacterium]|nr:hypothetical protein [Candidatus Paceibacterota bacterium]
MKKLIGSFLVVLVMLVVISTIPANAEESCICLENVEFSWDYRSFDPPKIEKLQIFGLLKEKGFENVAVNFRDRFGKNDSAFRGRQVDVTIVTINGKTFEGAARVNKGQYNTGLARAVKDALNPKE